MSESLTNKVLELVSNLVVHSSINFKLHGSIVTCENYAFARWCYAAVPSSLAMMTITSMLILKLPSFARRTKPIGVVKIKEVLVKSH